MPGRTGSNLLPETTLALAEPLDGVILLVFVVVVIAISIYQEQSMEIAKQIATAKSFPWPDASNVKYPLLTTAALQFAARAYPAICDGPRVVKCQVMGADADGKKSEAAERISQHMSYQLLYETSWEADIDTLLHQLPIIGCVFKKVYRDGTTDAGFCDDLVSAFDLIVNQAKTATVSVPSSPATKPML